MRIYTRTAGPIAAPLKRRLLGAGSKVKSVSKSLVKAPKDSSPNPYVAVTMALLSCRHGFSDESKRY